MENKENDTLRQRRKARESFLELKRMQSEGELEKEHKAYENEIKPQGFFGKLTNFWEYYKAPVLIIAFCVAVVIFCCVQCASRQEDDLRVVLFSNHIVTDNQSIQLEEYLETLCEDYNNDGIVNVTVVNCTFETASSTADYQNLKMQKLQSLIAVDQKATLFITTTETYKFIDGLGDGDFLSDYVELKDEMYNTVTEDMGVEPITGLVMSVRKIEGTLFDGKEEATEFTRRANLFVENY
jgi:hypothetical protein